MPQMRLDDLLNEVQSRMATIMATRDRIHALLEAVITIGEGLELETLLRRVAEAAVTLVNARYGAIGVIGPNRELTQFIPVGVTEEEIARIDHWPRGEGLLGLLIKEPRPLRLSAIADHPASVGFPKGHPEMLRFLGVPIRVRDEVFGNLYLADTTDGDDFDEDDETLVLALATAAGVAIENAHLFEETRRRETWLDASGEITTRLLSGADTDEVLRLVARRARLMSDADLALVALPERDQDRLTVRVCEGFQGDKGRGRAVDASGTLVGQVYNRGEPRLADVTTHPSLGAAFLKELGLGPVLLVPFGPPDRVRGVLIVGNRPGRSPFPDAVQDMLSTFADHAAVALELAEARDDAERLSVLEDRDRIARDLHDIVIQRLFATAMSLMGAANRIADKESTERVQRAVDDLDDTIRQIRSTIFELQHTAEGGADWLRSQIVDMVNGAAGTLGFAPRLLLEGPIDSAVDPGIADHLLAVLQEALSNVARHAGASQVGVDIRVADEAVAVQVEDDGSGVPEGGRRSGLNNVRTRAEELGGLFELRPRDGGGTVFHWRVPLA
ncbi:signal transduction histidine kinase [Nocardiopsis mwathae]|uniref:Signal transduction histidine kinase n=2 Tax=Nocardiopsis mwathae TaxID=1472723 RepID=A0A7W9YG66_9ACTN|nr:GAF domain-containing protein [Nocardiopsis mwathae]MBB6171494.1 signal transduction histidine kinase [Nocardiopsis mwathae]